MNLQTVRSIKSSVRSVAATLIVLSGLAAATVARGQQVIPPDDAMLDFSEAEIAARGERKIPNLTFSTWKKLCFRGAQSAETKMVCRTTVEGKSNIGQVIIRVDLIEREDAHATRLQMFVPVGLFLQPGIKLSVDKGATLHVPYTICLANGCAAATVAEPSFLRDLESSRTLSIKAVNANVVTVIASLPLDNLAQARQGAPEQIFEQKLQGK
jgi:invasion protein IalB